jgi:hypothetical protein
MSTQDQSRTAPGSRLRPARPDGKPPREST